MKNIILITILFISLLTKAEDSTRFNIPLKNWNLKVLGMENFYPTYLADPLGVRFEVSAQNIRYSDFEMMDEVNEGGDYLGKLTITPAVRISLFKFTSKKNPNLGAEVDLGVSTPLVMRAGNHDLIGTDGIYYFAIAGNPTDWLSLRFSKHHICTHLGDEYAPTGASTPIDFDPNLMQLPVRDDFIFSAAVEPLHFLKKSTTNMVRVYGDLGFFWPGVDFLGTRQNKPNKHAFMNYQAGMEGEYYFNKEHFGGLYAGVNISAYQSNAFSKNVSINAGYIIPQDRYKKRLRMGVHFYNGRPLSNQFYNRKEEFIAFSLCMDM